jgi:amino acid adenylation domain-containing protein
LAGFQEKSRFPYDFNRDFLTHEKISDDRTFQSTAFKLTGELYSRMMWITDNSDVRLHMLLVSLLVSLLYKYNFSREKDFIVGTPIYLQETEGNFVNTSLPLMNHLEERMTFKELLFLVKKNLEGAVEHQNYPIKALLSDLNILLFDESNDDFPLFDIAILLTNIQSKAYLRRMKLNMILSFSRTDESIDGVVEYNSTLYKTSTIERITGHFTSLACKVVFDPQLPIAAVDILTEDEKKQLLFDFNGTATEYPIDRTIPELFAEQVERTPDHIAVVFEDKNLTYRELGARANQLAMLLKRKGVTANTVVAVMVKRSIEMITGLLGILKAGGGYMPVEPDMPIKRVVQILEDCQPSILLSTDDITNQHPFTLFQNLGSIKAKPHLTGTRPQITDLDSLPIPDRSLVDHEKYNRYIGLAPVKNSITMQGSRGCPFKCAYCHRIWPKTHIVRSAEHIFEEIRMLHDIGIRRFSLIDDIFNLNEKNSRKFFESIIKNNLDIQLFFPNGLRGELLTKDYIDLMVEAGIVNISLSLETASPRLQKLIGKNLKIEKLRHNMEYICEKYPQVILDVQTMHGFPTETEEEAMMTLNFIKSMKWLHFPYLHILKIYPNTDMETLAIEHGITRERIQRSANQGYHELAETLPFDKKFSLKYQTEFLNDYFLSKERLMHVLPHQMKLLTEDEITQKYNAYLDIEITCFDDLLKFVGISHQELAEVDFPAEDHMYIPELNEKLKTLFPSVPPAADALKVLILDVSTYFSNKVDVFYDMIEPPLGPMYVLTYLKQQLGSRVNGKIAKSRMDFDNYHQLETLLEEFKPDLVGLRALTYYKDFFHQIAAFIRQWDTDVPIIAGGPYATSDYSTILQDRNIDLVVRGEAEITFCELVEEFIKNGGKLPGEEVLENIRGIAYVPRTGGLNNTFAREIVMLDKFSGLFEKPAENVKPTCCSSDLAYSIFTSGSAGKPKGTLISHHNVVRVVRDTNYIDLRNNDRVLQLSNYAFDGSVFDIYGALLNGSTLVLLKKDDVLAVDQLANLVKKEAITVFFVTTAMFNILVDLELEALKNTRKVLFGGEKVSVAHVEKALRYLGKNRIIHMYGPTESTVFGTYYNINEINKDLDTIPIGKPLSNTSVYIVNENLQPVPIGVGGEIYIGGDGVGKGYQNNPELTAEKFIDCPYIEGERLYKTGDIARWLPDGNIDFIGRIDQQVKLRGFRVEPGEIENRIKRQREIKDAVVTLFEREKGEKYICAYIVSERESAVSQLRDDLSKELPDYMIPSYFVHVGKIPLTSNGKVDRKALPHPQLGAGKAYLPPANEIEEKLLQIWEEVLGLEKGIIGVSDDFFEWGGHSLKVTLLVSKIHETLNIKLRMIEIFEKPTVRDLFPTIKKAVQEKYTRIEPVEKKEYYALSSAQKRLYIIQQMAKESTGYNMLWLLELEGILDKGRLEETFIKLIKRHESLRTSFCMVDREPVQKIHEDLAFKMEYYEVEENDSLATGIIKRFVRPYDLTQAPLLRLGLIKTGNQKHILMLDQHHIISDGVSQQLFTRESMALYVAEEPPALNLQYKDFSEWQNKFLKSEAIKEQEMYWLNQFEVQIPELNLNFDYERPVLRSFEGDLVEGKISGEETRKLQEIASKKGATLNMVLLAIFNTLLFKYTGQEDIVVGIPIAGRRHRDLNHIIGMFVNMLAMRNYPSYSLRFIDFLEDVKKCFVKAFDNQDYQFDTLIEKLKLTRSLSRQPLFDVVFHFHKIEPEMSKAGPGIKEEHIRIKPYKSEFMTSKFDLILTAFESKDTIFYRFNYCSRLFKKTTIERMGRAFETIVEQVVKDPEIEIYKIEIIDEQEISKIDGNTVDNKSELLEVRFNF